MPCLRSCLGPRPESDRVLAESWPTRVRLIRLARSILFFGKCGTARQAPSGIPRERRCTRTHNGTRDSWLIPREKSQLPKHFVVFFFLRSAIRRGLRSHAAGRNETRCAMHRTGKPWARTVRPGPTRSDLAVPSATAATGPGPAGQWRAVRADENRIKQEAAPEFPDTENHEANKTKSARSASAAHCSARHSQ